MVCQENSTQCKIQLPYKQENLSQYSSDLLVKIACFVTKEKKIVSVLEAAGLNQLVKGDQLYCAFPFSKNSML
jgi:hypothetical protein